MNSVFSRGKSLANLGRGHVHLDFHTPRQQREVGIDFDGERFTRTLKAAKVDGVTVFGKCERGYSYYNTDVGIRHPHLTRDLLREQIAACHEAGIKVLVYFSLSLDGEAGNQHPDWVQYDGQHNPLIRTPGWFSWLCYNSPYLEELVIPQIGEVLQYGADGFYFDCMYMHHDACTCHYCQEIMARANLDPERPVDRQKHVRSTCLRVADRITKYILSHDQDLEIAYNPTVELMGLQSELARYDSFITLGGHQAGWGYVHLPKFSRYVRNLDRAVYGMVGVFNIAWGDFGTLKHEAQASYEAAQILAHHFPLTFGDHLNPRGELEQFKYDLIGKVLGRAKELNLPLDAEPLRDIAVLYPGTGDWGRHMTPGKSPRLTDAADGLNGACKLLVDTHQQFDVLDEDFTLDLSVFQLLILPETGALRPETMEAVRKFVHDGGCLVASWDSSLGNGNFGLRDVFGVEFDSILPHNGIYFKMDRYAEEAPDPIVNMYAGAMAVVPNGAEVRAEIVIPIAEWGEAHNKGRRHGPPERNVGLPGVVYNKYGKGQVIYVASPVFTQYYAADYYVHRSILSRIITSLQSHRVLDADAPTTVDVNAMATEDAVFLHVLNFHADTGGGTLPRINDWPPAIDVTVRIHSPKRDHVASITRAKVSTQRKGDIIEISMSRIGMHEVVKIT